MNIAASFFRLDEVDMEEIRSYLPRIEDDNGVDFGE